MYTISSVIYKATNIINQKSYIGYTNNFEGRKRGHIKDSKSGSQFIFHRAIRKYGEENFIWEIVFESWDNDFCLLIGEDLIIQNYDSIRNGYNMIPGGKKPPINRMFGDENPTRKYGISEHQRNTARHTFLTNNPMNRPESREKVRISKLGERNPNFGDNRSLEEKYGIEKAVEMKRNMSEKMSGQNNPMYGKSPIPHNKGKSASIETRMKMSKSHKERNTEEVIEKRRDQTKYVFKKLDTDEIYIGKIRDFLLRYGYQPQGRIYINNVIKGKQKYYKKWIVYRQENPPPSIE